MSRTLRDDRIIAARLSDENFYESLIRRWQNEYFSLKRFRPFRLNQGVADVKSLCNLLAAAQIQEIGLPTLIEQIEDHRKSGCLDRVQVYRMKTKLTELACHSGLTEESEALSELDAKVRRAAMFCR